MFADSNSKLGRRTPIDRLIPDTIEQRDEDEPDEWKEDMTLVGCPYLHTFRS